MQSCQPLNITTSAAHSRYLHAFIHVQYVDREWQSLCCGRSSRSPTSFLWLQYIIQVEAHEARMRFCSFFLINPFGSGIGCPHFYFRISSLAIERSVNPCLEIPQHSYIVLIHTTSHRSGPFVYWCTNALREQLASFYQRILFAAAMDRSSNTFSQAMCSNMIRA